MFLLCHHISGLISSGNSSPWCFIVLQHFTLSIKPKGENFLSMSSSVTTLLWQIMSKFWLLFSLDENLNLFIVKFRGFQMVQWKLQCCHYSLFTGEIVSFDCQVRQRVWKTFSIMMLGMYRAFSRFQMSFNLCSIGDCGPEQRGKIWVEVAGDNELIILTLCFLVKSLPRIICPLNPAVKDTWLANPPDLSISQCPQAVRNSWKTSMFSWFLSGLRIWNNGETQWECLLSLADISMPILVNHYQTQERCGFGSFCAWLNRIVIRNAL